MMIMKGKTIIKEKLHYHYLMTCKYYILFIRDSKKKTDIEREEAMLVKENENILDELSSTSDEDG